MVTLEPMQHIETKPFVLHCTLHVVLRLFQKEQMQHCLQQVLKERLARSDFPIVKVFFRES